MGTDGILKHSSCKMYSLDSLGVNATEKCNFGWEYDKTDYESTIPSEFDWVCQRDHLATEVFTWTNVGSAVGTIIFGIFADKLVFF
jgi:hypothetical protein